MGRACGIDVSAACAACEIIGRRCIYANNQSINPGRKMLPKTDSPALQNSLKKLAARVSTVTPKNLTLL